MKYDGKKMLLSAGIIIFLVLTLNGCGGGDSSTYDGTNDTSSTVKAVTCPAGGTTDVAIDNFAYSPASVSVPVNTVVKWSNLDSSTHTVTSTTAPAGGSFDAQVNPGASVCLNFTAAGTYNYHCSIHPSMTGTVTVL